MKQNYTITVDSAVWQRLEEMAEQGGHFYRGRLSRSAVIEQLVAGATQPAAPVPAPAPASESPPVPVQPAVPAERKPVRLADVVAKWTANEKARWEQDKWKAGGWVQKVLDTINAGL